jgi:hypothetical protein
VIVSDAGYDVTRLAWVLRDLPAELVGRGGLLVAVDLAVGQAAAGRVS